MAHAEQVSPSHLCVARCRTYPDISGHIRTARHRGVKKARRVPYRRSPDRVPYRLSPVTSSRRARRVRYDLSPDRVPSGVSRAVSPVAGSRPIALVACRIARRRTRRRGWVPCALWRPGAGLRAVSPVAGSRLGVSLLVSATSMSLPCSRSGEPNTRHKPCPGPTWRGSRRRHRRFTNIFSFVSPWRSIDARSAARLRLGVGRHLNPNAHAAQNEMRLDL